MASVSALLLRKMVMVLSISTVVFSASSTFDGYTFLFSGSTAYLYGMDKKVIKQWNGLPQNAFCADLLRDSSILWASSDRGDWTRGGVATGGRLQIIKWDGTVVWDFRYRSADYMPHHDMEPIYYTNDPKEKPNIMVICYTAWGDKFTELKPTGLNTAEVVWEWYASDHTCEANTGANKPELLDKGKGGIGSFGGDFDRMHTNNVSFNRTLNLLVFSNKGYNEIMVIDHSTTTAEARGHTGGRYGKGGDILYRWGMPSNYGASGAQQLRGQHHAIWVPDTMLGTKQRMSGAFNLMCVDNGNRRVVEIVPPGGGNGVYPRAANAAFEPASPLWSYTVNDMAGNEGSVQRLPNGNTFICNGGGGGMGFGAGHVLEVSPSGTIVWEMTNAPPSTEGYRYPYGYLDGKVEVTVEAHPDFSARKKIGIVADPFTGRVYLTTSMAYQDAHLSLFSLDGREVLRSRRATALGWNIGDQPAGEYVALVRSGTGMVSGRISIEH